MEKFLINFQLMRILLKNKISGAQDLSFKAPLSNTFKPINGVSDNGNNISYIDVVVNYSLPNVSEVYKGGGRCCSGDETSNFART